MSASQFSIIDVKSELIQLDLFVRKSNALDRFKTTYSEAWANTKVVFVALGIMAILAAVAAATIFGVGGWEKCVHLINQMSQTEQLVSVGVLAFVSAFGITAFCLFAIPVIRKQPKPLAVDKIVAVDNIDPAQQLNDQVDGMPDDPLIIHTDSDDPFADNLVVSEDDESFNEI